jgi:hypothetical protein
MSCTKKHYLLRTASTSAKLLKRFLLEFFELPENGELAVRELAFQATKNRKGEDCMAVPVSVSWGQKGAYGIPSGTPTTLIAWRELRGWEGN